MSRWTSPGLQLVAIGVLHQAVGLWLGSVPLGQILADGYVASIDGQSAERAVIFWFLWFGWALILLGGAVRSLEHRGLVPVPLAAGTALLVIGGGLAMPASGFWLALVPVVGMLAPHVSRRADPLRTSTPAPR